MSRIDDILDAEETVPTIDKDTIIKKVVQNLEQVYDPEMPSVSVIHLGLIYDIEILENNTLVKITHFNKCILPDGRRDKSKYSKAGMVTGIKECIANCTFQPPFSMDMVPEETKLAMGWL